MKTGVLDAGLEAAPIVQLVDAHPDAAAEAAQLARARAFAEPLLTGRLLDTGEDALAHAEAVAAILQGIGAAPTMRAAAFLVYAGDYLNKPDEVIAKAFGPSHASLVVNTRKLVQLQRAAREAQLGTEARAQQTERILKAMENPHVSMLAHPTGRLIDEREPYDADMPRIGRIVGAFWLAPVELRF